MQSRSLPRTISTSLPPLLRGTRLTSDDLVYVLIRQQLVGQGRLPETEQHHVGRVPLNKGCEEVLIVLGRDLDCIGYENSGLLLGDGGHFLPVYHHLVLPTEDVAVEATGGRGHVHPPLVQDILVVGTAVVHHEPAVNPHSGEEALELLPPGLVAGVHAR